MTATKLAIILGIIAIILLATGYYRIEQSIIYGDGIVVKDDLIELQGQMR